MHLISISNDDLLIMGVSRNGIGENLGHNVTIYLCSDD